MELGKKVYIVDNSALEYNPQLFDQITGDIIIPSVVLDQLTALSVLHNDEGRNALHIVRLLVSVKGGLGQWAHIPGKICRVRIVYPEKNMMPRGRYNDYQYRFLNTALHVRETISRDVVILTRARAMAEHVLKLGFTLEPVMQGVTISAQSAIPTGKKVITDVPDFLLKKLGRNSEISFADHKQLVAKKPGFCVLRTEKQSFLGFMHPQNKVVEHVKKRKIFGITPNSAEQAFALHALLHPDMFLVTLQGVPGGGKTLLSLAAGLHLLRKKRFKYLYFARPTVALSNKDIGYIPGDIEQKLNPFLEPFYDNLKVIQEHIGKTDADALLSFRESGRLKPVALEYLRGRTLRHTLFIIDEAQNLSEREIKAIITRAGEGCKIIFTGDVFQIDDPDMDYLTNGFSQLIDKVMTRIHTRSHMVVHIGLEKCKRSDLARLAVEVLT